MKPLFSECCQSEAIPFASQWYCTDCREPCEVYDPEDEEETDGDDNCPSCGQEYDEIDYEYQICQYCNHNNNQEDNEKEPQPPMLCKNCGHPINKFQDFCADCLLEEDDFEPDKQTHGEREKELKMEIFLRTLKHI